MEMSGDGVGFVEDAAGITIWGMAEPESERKAKAKSKTESEAESKAKSKAADPSAGLRASRSVRSTQATSTRANPTEPNSKPTEALTPKQLGEIAEAEFIAKAVGMGFVVARPWGDSEPYDFIVNPKKSFIFWRVQVKSAHTIGADGGCSFRAHDHQQRSYTARDIDALVAYARPMNAWYVMPVRVVEELKSLMLYPESRKRRSRFERWREAWEVLRKAVRRRR
jgi:PD-(D/E)XK nuclease superfamily protein